MSDRRMFRVVTVDAQALMRAGVKQIFAGLTDVAVIGEADSSADALGLCERLCPDLLLFDAAMPGGLTLIAQLHERRKATRVLILTDRVDLRLLASALQLGCVGRVSRRRNRDAELENKPARCYTCSIIRPYVWRWHDGDTPDETSSCGPPCGQGPSRCRHGSGALLA